MQGEALFTDIHVGVVNFSNQSTSAVSKMDKDAAFYLI